ncbi:MAG: acyltransferase family protein [Rhizobiaceae bacterium]
MATLDLLRLVAALAVVCFHYLFRGEIAADGHGLAYEYASGAAIYGYLGVHLFFLISGFVIAWSAEGREFSRFALARFARLYPGFLVCMTISFVVLWMIADPNLQVSIPQYIANLFMFSKALGQPFVDGVYWSIILEIIFYGWVAIALFFGVFERWKLGLLACWLLICAGNEFWLGNGAVKLVFITEYGALFVSGVLIHHIYAHGRTSEAVALLTASFFVSTASMSAGRDWMLDHYGQAVPMAGLVVSNIVIYGLLIGAVMLRSRLAPSRLVLMLGGLTYPLYLLHQNIGYLAIKGLAPVAGSWIAFAATTAVMLLLSWTIWRFIETPARRKIIASLAPFTDAISMRISRKPIPAPAE